MTTAYENVSTLDNLLAGFQRVAPVNLQAIADHLGLRVWELRHLPDGVSGKIFHDSDHGGTSGYSIGVNANEAYTRKRFTLAHEIAHYLLHKDAIGDGIQDDALYRSKLSGRQEVEANRLAADILMPYPLIRRLQLSGINDVNGLAQRFEVSVPAMKIRLGVPMY